MYDTLKLNNTPGGTWTVTPGGIHTPGNNYVTAPASSGCYTVTYSNVPNPNGCTGSYTSTKKMLIVIEPDPDFTIDGSNSSTINMCAADPVTVNVLRTSSGANPVLTLNGSPAALGMHTLAAPAPGQSIVYNFCLTETNNNPPSCFPLPPGYQNCSEEKCIQYVVYNDGICGSGSAAFDSECAPGSQRMGVCSVSEQPELQLGCAFFQLTVPFKVIEARIQTPSTIAFCSTDSVVVEIDAHSFLKDIPGFDVVLGTLPGADVICTVAEFCICLPLLPEIHPFGWLNPGDWCNSSMAQLISNGLASYLGGNKPGGFATADTDGDGAFDYVGVEYETFPFPASGFESFKVPNNVDKPGRSITVRHVSGWPAKADAACGAITSESINLLDILSPFIDLIPVAGPIINGVIAGAQCNLGLVFTDAEDVVIDIVNNEAPVFSNCPPNGYVFSEDFSCQTAANWSIPIAEDACFGGNLVYQGRTAGTDASDFPGSPDPVVLVTGSGIYQTAGPIPGSVLSSSPGMYTVTYTAYSCNAITSECTFPVLVTAGAPELECPNDMVVYTDIDTCLAAVTGLTPVSGIGCATIINYSVDYPAVPGFIDVSTNTPYSVANRGTHHDVSGLPFPRGVTNITYTMLVDLNGDGDADDAGESTNCTFSLTVLDNQQPIAYCIDQEIQLDVNGSGTVYATAGDGSPYIDGGSFDNCDPNPEILIQKPGEAFGSSVNFDCTEVGTNYVNLRVLDQDGNYRTCFARVEVIDYLHGVNITLDPPEICLEANNPMQLDFSNYLSITLESGLSISHSEVPTFLGGSQGYFAITMFHGTGDPGSITQDGVYTPGTGNGYVTISYIILPGNIPPPDGNVIHTGCFKIEHANFELRQPLDMVSPECACVMENERIVDLGSVTGGLEPYTIQYTDAVLDVDGDGIVDDVDGEYVYDAANGYDINDYTQDLGELRVVYTPYSNWSFTIVDARGCELFRSGSCDNDDLTESPTIICPANPPTLFTEPLACESQYEWQHPQPHDNCAVVIYNYQITNPDGTIEGPFVLDDLIAVAPNPNLFEAEYEFEKGVTTVYYYAEDAVGNTGTCSFQVTVLDDDPPYFINCPYPPVIENAETDHCDAYVNFALPLAEDNCDVPIVTQIDNTGLTTGSRFPVGTTVMYWEAVDLSDNRDTCQVKVIVNDYWQNPSLTCRADVVQDNDLWLCSADVFDIAPTVDGPCEDNYAITYSIYGDAALTDRKECGVWDASGETFEVGMSWVKYSVQNQPLLLITEVTQSAGVDQLEITNLGPAKIDLTCLEINRVAANPAADETIGPLTMLPSLAPTPLGVGEVMVFDFAFDGAAGMGACYTISYAGTIIDEVAVNGYGPCGNFTGSLASGDVIRHCEDDSNDAADWVAAENCAPLTIGMLNPDLHAMPDNGKMASLQSIPPNKVSCTFKVTIVDAENPFCGKLDEVNTYNGAGINPIDIDACNRSTITIPAPGCIIGEIVFDMAGTATPANSTITLISPTGIEVPITEIPLDSIDALYLQKSAGDWILDVVPNVGANVSVSSWSLTITCLDTFDMADVMLDNDPGVCGAEFTWTHPFFADNCFEGTISVEYITTDADCTPTGGQLLGHGGYEQTEFFCVGTTTVKYTLVDAAGNMEMCSFDVTVKDVEAPVVVCPNDIYVNLDPGACGAFVHFAPVSATDNCGVVDTVMTPPSGSWFEIGDNLVTIIIFDEAGNSDTCTFFVKVIEYVPHDYTLYCNDLTHVSLDSTCVYQILADGVLEGNDYHCYDDYIITVKNAQGQIIGNTLNASDVGKTYTVTVLDPETGNTCWSYIHLEDKLAPKLTCPPNKVIACSESTAPANTGDIVVKDCSNFNKVIDEEYFDNGECGDPRGVLTRTWIVTDVWGNQSICSHTITITPFDLDDVVFPAEAIVDCEDVYLNSNATSPDFTGRPSINGAPIGTGGYCSASIGYTDARLDVCAGSYEIYRTWLVANTCLPAGPDNPVSYVQRIRVKDFSGPTFDCPPTVFVSTDPFTCCSTAALPDMIVSEGCSNISDLEAKVTGTDPATGNLITFTVPGHLGDFPGNNYWNPDTLAIFDYTQCLPLGTYQVRYKASDQCGNTSFCYFDLTVADFVPPVASCDQTTVVAVNGDDPYDCYTPEDGCDGAGVTWIKASTFNDGSYDNCNDVKLTIRRMPPYSDCINNLSHDPCYPGGESEFDIATAESDSIKFYCCEVGTSQTVVLRVYQVDANGDYVPGLDGDPLYNECMIQLEVQDKVKPICQSPNNVTVTCEQFDPSLWLYGKADIFDNCCLDETKEYQGQCGLTHSVNYSQFDTLCNKGTIVRTFRAFDCHGQSSQCTQRIVVNYEQDYYVRFPNDVIVTVCDGTGNYGEPTFFGEDCELIGVSYEDEVFTVVPDACFKIERTWRVINWCTYNPNGNCIDVPNPNPNATTNHPSNLPGPIVSPIQTSGDPWKSTIVKIYPTDPQSTNYSIYYDPNANCYTYKQIIKIIDTQDPIIDDCPASPVTVCDVTDNDSQLWNASYWWDNANESHDLCEAPSDICITATDLCSGSNINIEYQLFLDLDGDGVMETVVNSTQLGNQPGGLGWNNIMYGNVTGAGQSREFDGRLVPTNQKWGFAIQETVSGTDKTACVKFNTFQSQSTYVAPQLPHGTHKIKWFVSDGCGNESICEYTIIVKDCKAPTVVCLNGLSVNIMPTGMIQLWATDFLQYAEDNCTLNPYLKYGVRKCGQGTGFPVDAQGNPITNVTFDCTELGTQCVELWAIDLAGNADYCETYVIVQDNNGNCPAGSTVVVSGVLATEMQDGVEEAMVDITGSVNFQPPFSYFGLTNDQGIFTVSNSVPIAADFTVSPSKDDNPLNGVTTYDLVLISKHILGIEPLGSPYKMIAADANKSNSITTFDVVELRKLILGIYTELPNNTSWRFVDKSYTFPNALNPFQEVFSENISIADAQSHQLAEDFVGVKIGDVNNTVVANSLMASDDRALATLLFDVKDREVNAGEEFEVTFNTSEKTQGYQMTLNLLGLKVSEIVTSDAVGADNFGVFDHALTVSIDGAQSFTVKFRAEKSGKLSELLGVSGRITKAEAYSLSNNLMDVALRFDNKTIAGVGFELYQNQPNPFVNKTMIGFHLPEAATATLTVYDETGRVVFVHKGNYAKGYNSVMLDRALLNTTGLLYYRLETSSDASTKKMIQSK
ncbi:MAG: HYR domain-containing protein [Lewinellaceae bacterium]|nr:HYR domain-containing protein [Saprospiraceae bacterium]MCB9343889.1 HYR domain-containing protein [Lewinellaceae bacterium]